MNVMFNILSVLGWAWTPVAFAVWGTAVRRRRQDARRAGIAAGDPGPADPRHGGRTRP